MKIHIFFAFFLLYSTLLFSQNPSPAEIEKMMKEAKEELKKYSTDPAVAEKLKELEKNEKTFTGIVNNNKTEISNAINNEIKVETAKFPVIKSKLLSTLPKKILTREEVRTYAMSLYADLQKFSSSSSVQSVKKIIQQYNDAATISEAAVFAWYNNAPEQSTLLAVYAATQKQDDNILNTCGALLNLGGLEAKALPILKSLLPANPNSSTLLNNIGQSFAGLGAKDSAIVYLMACMKQSPNHPTACATAAYLEREKGNTERSKEYLKKSLEGSYDENASRLVKFLEPDFRLSRFAKPRVKVPEYFNIHKYLPFPIPCQSVTDIPRAVAEYREFKAMLDREIEKFKKLEKEASEQNEAVINKMTNNFITGFGVSKGSIMRTPFYKFCVEMTDGIAKELMDKTKTFSEQTAYNRNQMRLLKENYKLEYQKILAKYVTDGSCCGEGRSSCCPDDEKKCKELNALASVYMAKSNALLSDLQQKAIHPFQNFNEMAFWNYLSYIPTPAGIMLFRSSFYSHAISYLTTLKGLTDQVIEEPWQYCNKQSEGDAALREGGNIKEPDCPFDIGFPFVVGQIGINCESLQFEVGEGLILNIEKGFNGRPSSIAIGAGAAVHVPGPKIGKQELIDIGAKGQFFISFGGKNEPSDMGFLVEGGVEFPGSGKDGWKAGVNSGWNFQEGPLKTMADKMYSMPAETPVIKNMNNYKPNN